MWSALRPRDPFLLLPCAPGRLVTGWDGNEMVMSRAYRLEITEENLAPNRQGTRKCLYALRGLQGVDTETMEKLCVLSVGGFETRRGLIRQAAWGKG